MSISCSLKHRTDLERLNSCLYLKSPSNQLSELESFLSFIFNRKQQDVKTHVLFFCTYSAQDGSVGSFVICDKNRNMSGSNISISSMKCARLGYRGETGAQISVDKVLPCIIFSIL